MTNPTDEDLADITLAKLLGAELFHIQHVGNDWCVLSPDRRRFQTEVGLHESEEACARAYLAWYRREHAQS